MVAGVSSKDLINPKDRILNEAQNFAEKGLLAPSENQNSSVTVHHHHHHHDSWSSFWWRPYSSPCYVYPVQGSSCHKNTTKRDQDNSFWVAIAAAIITLTTAFFIGKDLGVVANSNQKLETLAKDKKEVKTLPKVVTVIKQEEKMVKDLKEKAKQSLWLKGAFAISSGLVGAGAVLANSAVLNAGLIGGAVSGAALLLREGFASIDNTQQSSAATLLKVIQEARV